MKVKFGPVRCGQCHTGVDWVGIAWGGIVPPSSDACAQGPVDATVLLGLVAGGQEAGISHGWVGAWQRGGAWAACGHGPERSGLSSRFHRI